MAYQDPYAAAVAGRKKQRKPTKKPKNPYASGGSTPETLVKPQPPVEEVVLSAMAGPGDIGADRPAVVDPTNMSDMYADKGLVSGAKGTKPPGGFGHPGGGTTPTTGSSASASIGGDMAKEYEAINISPGTNLQPDPTSMEAAYADAGITPGTNLQPDPTSMAGAYDKLDIAPGDDLRKTDPTDMAGAYGELDIAPGDNFQDKPLSMEEEYRRLNLMDEPGDMAGAYDKLDIAPGDRLGDNVQGGTGYDEDIRRAMEEAMGSSPEPAGKPATLGDLTGDVTQVLSDRLGMKGSNPAIDRDIMDYIRQSEREEAQLMEDLNRMGVLRSGDTAEALGDFRGARSRTIADLSARGYDQQSDAIQDLLEWQRGEREKQLTEDELLSSSLGREIDTAGQTGEFRDDETLGAELARGQLGLSERDTGLREKLGAEDIRASTLGREIDTAGQTGQFRGADTMAERALSDDLQTSKQARNLAQSANARAENLSQQQILDAVLGREVLTDENLRAEQMVEDDLKSTDLNRRLSEAGVTGRFDPNRYGEGIRDTLEKQRLDDDLLNRLMQRDIQEAAATGMYREGMTVDEQQRQFENQQKQIGQALSLAGVADSEVLRERIRNRLDKNEGIDQIIADILKGTGLNDTPPPSPNPLSMEEEYRNRGYDGGGGDGDGSPEPVSTEAYIADLPRGYLGQKKTLPNGVRVTVNKGGKWVIDE